ncbi:SMI1/KNR4 family protein [Candidatus Spyradosoma sp. SGI.093]|uniref:SMI1/KNR4 family protein n=1 Tax=Candidatus Spyradosoma sp. SGI.093 TaxID=3420583 RepID=UPI003D02A127
MNINDLKKTMPSLETSPRDRLPSAETLNSLEMLLGMKFPGELREYLENLGYVAFSFVELNGVNEIQKEKSDMIRATLNFREAYPKVERKFWVLEDRSEEDYALCCESGDIFEFLPSVDREPRNLNMTLTEYLKSRYAEIQEFERKENSK